MMTHDEEDHTLDHTALSTSVSFFDSVDDAFEDCCKRFKNIQPFQNDGFKAILDLVLPRVRLVIGGNVQFVFEFVDDRRCWSPYVCVYGLVGSRRERRKLMSVMDLDESKSMTVFLYYPFPQSIAAFKVKGTDVPVSTPGDKSNTKICVRDVCLVSFDLYRCNRKFFCDELLVGIEDEKMKEILCVTFPSTYPTTPEKTIDEEPRVPMRPMKRYKNSDVSAVSSSKKIDFEKERI